MRLDTIYIFLILALHLIALPALLPPKADAQNVAGSCLTDLEGLYMKWDSTWQHDKADDGIIYVIGRATRLPSAKIPLLVLELSSTSKSAIEQFRRLTIKNDAHPQGFCGNIATNMEKLLTKSTQQKPSWETDEKKELSHKVSLDYYEEPDSSKEKPKLSFIELRNGKWVRGEWDGNTQTKVCRILNKKFACPARDKRGFERKAALIESDIRLLKSLGY